MNQSSKQVRKLNAARGAGWIVDGFALLKPNARVLIGIGLIAGALASLPLFSLLYALLSPVFHAGLLSAFASQQRGETPKLSQLFDGFSQPGAFARLLPLIGVLVLAVLLMVALLLLTLAPMLAMETAGKPPSGAQLLQMLGSLGLSLLVMIPLGVLMNWLMFLAVPRVMLDQVPGFDALREAFSAMFANIGALLVNLLCWMVLGMVMLLPLLVLVALIGGAFGLVGLLAAQFFVQLLLGCVFAAVYTLMLTASMYQAWCEIYPPSAQPTVVSVEI